MSVPATLHGVDTEGYPDREDSKGIGRRMWVYLERLGGVERQGRIAWSLCLRKPDLHECEMGAHVRTEAWMPIDGRRRGAGLVDAANSLQRSPEVVS